MTKHLMRWQLYTGLAGIVVLWTGVTIGLRRAQLGLLDSRPISYLGVNPSSQTLFTVTLVISAVLFLSFGYYVNRHYHITNRFMLYFTIGQVAQVIAAFVPNTAGSRYKSVHTTAAFILAFSLPLLIREFKNAQRKHKQYELFSKLSQLESASFFIGIGLFIFTNGLAPLGEALPAIGFHIWIIAVTYVVLTESKTIGKHSGY